MSNEGDAGEDNARNMYGSQAANSMEVDSCPSR